MLSTSWLNCCGMNCSLKSSHRIQDHAIPAVPQYFLRINSDIIPQAAGHCVCFPVEFPGESQDNWHGRPFMKIETKDFPDSSVVKTPPFNAGDPSSILDQRTNVSHAIGCGQKFKKIDRERKIRSPDVTSTQSEQVLATCCFCVQPWEWEIMKMTPALLFKPMFRAVQSGSQVGKWVIIICWEQWSWIPEWMELWLCNGHLYKMSIWNLRLA